jgi:hypothetical protein
MQIFVLSQNCPSISNLKLFFIQPRWLFFLTVISMRPGLQLHGKNPYDMVYVPTSTLSIFTVYTVVYFETDSDPRF